MLPSSYRSERLGASGGALFCVWDRSGFSDQCCPVACGQGSKGSISSGLPALFCPLPFHCMGSSYPTQFSPGLAPWWKALEGQSASPGVSPQPLHKQLSCRVGSVGLKKLRACEQSKKDFLSPGFLLQSSSHQRWKERWSSTSSAMSRGRPSPSP